MAITNPFGSSSSIGIFGMGSSRSNKKRKNKSKVLRRKKRNHHKKVKQKMPHTAGKRRDRSMRRIRYTVNNQPYVIMANGRARFISKKSAKTSRKRQGGKY